MKKLIFLLAFALSACQADETLTGYGAADQTWTLQSIDGAAFTARADITFPSEGTIAGHAPCNSYGAQQTAPYPWFSASALRATRAACPELALEQAFFAALADMTLAEVSGGVMILSNSEGREMVFKAGSAE